MLRQRRAPATATEIALARLKVELGSQRLRLVDEMSTRLVVRAPSAGTVTSLLTNPGAAVDLFTPLGRVEDLDHLVVALDLTEFDVAKTRVGSRASISVDALAGRRFTGQVVDVALTGFEAGGVVNFPVIIALRAARGLRPGMSVSARVVVAEHQNVVRLPVGTIIDKGDGQVIRVRSAAGTIEERKVEVGLTGPDGVEIVSGLRAGEHVLVPAAAPGGGP